MKPDIHPAYGPVVFRDQTTGETFLTRSTLAGQAERLPSITWTDGATYPLVNADVTSASHPFYTGKAVVLDSAGQVQRFRRRYGKYGLAGDQTSNGITSDGGDADSNGSNDNVSGNASGNTTSKKGARP